MVGSFVVRDPAEVITTDPGFFRGFSIVIATQLTEAQALALEAILVPSGTPLVVSAALRRCVPVLELVRVDGSA